MMGTIKQYSDANSIYNQAIEDASAFIEKRNGPKPCSCAVFDVEIGYWMSRCDCGNYDDNAMAAGWVESSNVVLDLLSLKK